MSEGNRGFTVTVINYTNENFGLSSEAFEHGRWEDTEHYAKPSMIKSLSHCCFKVCSKSGALYGVTGTVTWYIDNAQSNRTWSIRFDKPLGDKPSTFTASVGESSQVYATVTYPPNEGAGGHWANPTVEIRPISKG